MGKIDHTKYKKITFRDGLLLRSGVEIGDPIVSEFWNDVDQAVGAPMKINFFVPGNRELVVAFDEHFEPTELFGDITLDMKNLCGGTSIHDILHDAFVQSIVERGEVTFSRELAPDPGVDNDSGRDQSENVVCIELLIDGQNFFARLDRETSMQLFEYDPVNTELPDHVEGV